MPRCSPSPNGPNPYPPLPPARTFAVQRPGALQMVLRGWLRARGVRRCRLGLSVAELVLGPSWHGNPIDRIQELTEDFRLPLNGAQPAASRRQGFDVAKLIPLLKIIFMSNIIVENCRLPKMWVAHNGAEWVWRAVLTFAKAEPWCRAAGA